MSTNGSVSRHLDKRVCRGLIIRHLANCITNTPCGMFLAFSCCSCRCSIGHLAVVFIGCRAPVDPVQLVQAHVHQVEKSGTSRSRYQLLRIYTATLCSCSLQVHSEDGPVLRNLRRELTGGGCDVPPTHRSSLHSGERRRKNCASCRLALQPSL